MATTAGAPRMTQSNAETCAMTIVGAINSAASQLSEEDRWIVRALGAGLISTSVLLLAHRASDVVVGSAIGVVLERLIRCATGYDLGKLPQRASPWCSACQRTIHEEDTKAALVMLMPSATAAVAAPSGTYIYQGDHCDHADASQHAPEGRRVGIFTGHRVQFRAKRPYQWQGRFSVG
ncbi:hypothetical protein [Bradyrhizobium uaiense]|uniref:Phosphatase PAP2 family protein n=1 Tax=Bradyrhizobium uaiense TaxID=2594946 RepID=A0A6P1BTP6_9BRAD|nr:hypothetical protein [Bradyrhizobium uaiense]NEV01689.1 hypothetical protein [Bradyrhizobium uaiense]